MLVVGPRTGHDVRLAFDTSSLRGRRYSESEEKLLDKLRSLTVHKSEPG